MLEQRRRFSRLRRASRKLLHRLTAITDRLGEKLHSDAWMIHLAEYDPDFSSYFYEGIREEPQPQQRMGLS